MTVEAHELCMRELDPQWVPGLGGHAETGALGRAGRRLGHRATRVSCERPRLPVPETLP